MLMDCGGTTLIETHTECLVIGLVAILHSALVTWFISDMVHGALVCALVTNAQTFLGSHV